MGRLLIPTNQSEFKNNNFDAIRIAMALSVVWSHSFALYLGSERTEPLSILFGGLYNAGNIGVMGFFIISGFLVTKSFMGSKSMPKFMVRRIRRIYPGYLVATSICAFLIIPAYAHVMKMDAVEVFKTIGLNLLLRNYFPPSNAFLTLSNVNGSLWSIPYEFWCYIGVAALGIAGFLLRRNLLILATIGILLGRVLLDLLDKKPGGGLIGYVIGWPYLWFVILPNFLLGMLAYDFRDVIPKSPTILVCAMAAMLFSCHVNVHLAHLIFPIALAYMIFYAAFNETIRLQNIAIRGDFSYGTYLYAFPIQQMLKASFFAIPFIAYICASMLLSLCAGILSWHLVEKWFIKRRSIGKDTKYYGVALSR